jgi:hypothetical protein
MGFIDDAKTNVNTTVLGIQDMSQDMGNDARHRADGLKQKVSSLTEHARDTLREKSDELRHTSHTLKGKTP